jgi:hypothetical protein
MWYGVSSSQQTEILLGNEIGQTISDTFAGLGTLAYTNGIGWAEDNPGSADPEDFAEDGTAVFLTIPPPVGGVITIK